MKKTVIMGINRTIKRIKQTANLEVIGIKDVAKKQRQPQSPSAALNNNLYDS